MRKLFAVLSVLIVASMLLTACGTAATTAPAATSAAATTAATEAATTAAGSGAAAAVLTSKDPTSFVEVTAGDIDTLDPALAYDTASGEIIQNTYNTLIFYDGAEPSKFVPMLATEVPSQENGGISADGLTWTWKIRSGVTFHNGDPMTPSDVAFSFQRGMLQGGASSPQLMIYPAFFGVGIDDITTLVKADDSLVDDRDSLVKEDPALLKSTCEKVKAAVVADDAAGTVTFHFAQPYLALMPQMAQTWMSVMDAKWVAENKGWDGSCDTWQNFYGMTSAEDPFTNIENGTGPFSLSHREANVENTLTAFDKYWAGAPALKTVSVKYIPEWGTRFSMLQTGDADVVYVPVENRSQADAMVGEKCQWDDAAGKYGDCAVTDASQPLRLYIGRPQTTQQDVIIYNFAIATSKESPNPYMGSGKLDGNGIPADFFSDVHIRKGFSYAFDWDTFVSDVYNGEAVQSLELSTPGMVGYDANAPHYTMDLEKSAAEFKLADLDHDGIAAGDETDGTDVWSSGFYMMMLYNTGNTTRQITSEILASNLAQVNEKFVIQTLGLPWASYLAAQRAKQIPIMTAGWQEDVADPDNWYTPYTTGTYGLRQSMPDDLKAQFKTLLIQGLTGTTDEARAAAYAQINQLYYDTAPGIPIVIQTSHAFEQRWVNGVVRNPLFPGFYFYPISKK